MRNQIAQLVHRAALNENIRPQTSDLLLETGRPVDYRQLRLLEAAFDHVIEDRSPRRFALPAHVAYGKQDLLAVAAHTQHNKQRNPGRLTVNPNTHNRTVQDQANDVLLRQIARVPRVPVSLELAPHTAHRVLRYRTPEQ